MSTHWRMKGSALAPDRRSAAAAAIWASGSRLGPGCKVQHVRGSIEGNVSCGVSLPLLPYDASTANPRFQSHLASSKVSHTISKLPLCILRYLGGGLVFLLLMGLHFAADAAWCDSSSVVSQQTAASP